MDRRLPPHAKRTLRALWRAVERSDHDQQQGLPKEHARRVVAAALADDDEEEIISDEEVDHQLEFLHDYGEIYYVNDWVRITTPEEVMPDRSENHSDTRNQDSDPDPNANEGGVG